MENNNILLCDPDTGVCEIPTINTATVSAHNVKSLTKPVKVIYFTDPICSTCWGIEPQLRKFKLEYGHEVEFDYRMGGLLPDWNYNSGGISGPADVAGHWDEVSLKYDMPIDGDLWLEDPMSSSYPPSIAFKAAQMQDNHKAILFLREIREMVFLRKINIEKLQNLERAAETVGLDICRFSKDFVGEAVELFNMDLQLGKEMGVRGFPTMFFSNTAGRMEKVYGLKPYSDCENMLLELYPEASKKDYDKSWKALFTIFPSLTAKEFAELADVPREEVEAFLTSLTKEGVLNREDTKNGSVWKKAFT